MIRTLLPICCAAALVAGCGSHNAHQAAPPAPKLPREVGAQLASLSETVAEQLRRGDVCGARSTAHDLQTQALAAVASGEVPIALRMALTRATTDLTARIQCVTRPSTKHGHQNEHGKGKHRGHGGGD